MGLWSALLVSCGDHGCSWKLVVVVVKVVVVVEVIVNGCGWGR